MADVLKVGIAGLGFGATEFIPTLERLEEIEIVAGADLRPQALEAFQERYGGRTYEKVHWVLSKRVVNRLGDVEYKDIPLFHSDIPLVRSLREKIERDHLIRTETNDSD